MYARNPDYQRPSRELERTIVDAFCARGHRIYVVGGTVRDRLLGRESLDLDFATDATPAQSKAILAQLQPTAIYPLGEKFGTVAALFDSVKVEVTTFRHRDPQSGTIVPGGTLEEDLAHRDFTINAMALDPLTGQLLDPFQGMSDLKHRLIRAVGSAWDRIVEDPIRILRAARLACELDFRIDPEFTEAARKLKHRLVHVAFERIGEELSRTLTTSRPSMGIRLLDEMGALEILLPELQALKHAEEDRNKYKDIFEHTLKVLDRTPSILPLRWAALLHDVGKPRTRSTEGGEVTFFGHERVGAEMAQHILKRFRLSQATANRVSRLILLHTQANSYHSQWTDSAVRRLMREAGEDIFLLLELSKADVTSYRPSKVRAAVQRVEELKERIQRILEEEDLKRLRSPLDGNELMAIFDLPPGPWIREVKDYLLDMVIAGDLRQEDKASAIKLACRYLRQHANQLGVAPRFPPECHDGTEQ
jgi:poly(A) polymerase